MQGRALLDELLSDVHHFLLSYVSFVFRILFILDELRHNDAGVLPSSGGVIELNENTTSLTVQSMNVTIPYYGYLDNYWFVTGPVGSRLKVEFHQLNAGHFHVYDNSSQSGIVSRFSSPSIMPEDRVFSQNAGTLYFQFNGTYGGVGLLFTISITGELLFKSGLNEINNII